jgi:hypothetical protein
VSVVRDTPVEAPLEKGRRQTLRKGVKLTPPILKEEDPRSVKAPEPGRGSESHVEIGDARVVLERLERLERIIPIEEAEASHHTRETGPHLSHERADSEAESTSLQLAPKLRGRKFSDVQD